MPARAKMTPVSWDLYVTQLPDGAVQTWKVVGWQVSRERRDEIAERLAAGVSPPA